MRTAFLSLNVGPSGERRTSSEHNTGAAACFKTCIAKRLPARANDGRCRIISHLVEPEAISRVRWSFHASFAIATRSSPKDAVSLKSRAGRNLNDVNAELILQLRKIDSSTMPTDVVA